MAIGRRARAARRAMATVGLAVVALGTTAAARSAPTRQAPAAGPPPTRVAAPRPPFTTTDTARLRARLDSLVQAHRGVVGYAVHNLDTGERLSARGDEPFPTASLIKVPVLVTVFDLVARGVLALDDPLTVLKIDMVPGAGTLQYMHPGITITVRDAAWLMTTISDNTATNLLLDRIIIRRVWEKMEALGLPRTKVHSKSFLRASSVAMDSSVKYGLGVTTPNEMARLFALLADGKAVSPAADSTMLDILAHNGDEMKLARFAYGVPLAHKTGDVDQARTDCGVFSLPAKVVTCVMTKENADTRYWGESDGNTVIARIGEAVVRTWRRAPSSPDDGSRKN